MSNDTNTLRPYSEMVASLFKVSQMNENAVPLLHAIIGISTEVGEIQVATDRTNLVEEYGDLAFYVEAAKQAIKTYWESMHDVPMLPLEDVAATNLQAHANELLDLVKKLWVYRKNPTETLHKIRQQLFLLEVVVYNQYDFFDLTESMVLKANQHKLGIRYPAGVYADHDAVARADKSEG